MNRKTGTKLIIIFIFIVAAILRLYLLFTSQHFLDGDEAVIGLMAKHILELGEHPLFWYGLHYNGGGSWEAHLGAVTLLAGGYSDYSLKFSAFIISMFILLILYFWAKENFGNFMGNLVAYFYVFSVSFIQWNLKLRGHLTLILCIVVLLWASYRFLFENQRSGLFPLILGLLSGLSVWCLESSLIIIFTFLLFWFYQDRKFFFRGVFYRMVGMFLIGVSPVIYENFAHNFQNIKHLFGSPVGISGAESITHKILTFFSHDFPSLFHWDIVHNYPENIPWYAWIGYIMVMLATAYFIIVLWKPLKGWLIGWWGRDKIKKHDSEGGKLLFLAIYLLLFLSAFIFSKYSSMSPRYLLTLMPGIFIILALSVQKLFQSRLVILKFAGLVVMFLWAFMGVKNTLAVSRDFTVIDGFNQSHSPDLPALVSVLKNRKIETAYADKFIKNRVIFYSREEIIVSRFRNHKGGVIGNPPLSLYPHYERIVDENEGESAYIFGDQPRIKEGFENFLKAEEIRYQRNDVGGYSFYHEFEPPFNPGQFLNHLLNHGFTPGELLKYL